jgi:hypothetical protein
MFELAKKKIWANLQSNVDLLYAKTLSLSSQKYGLGSGIRAPEKTYPGSRGQKGI